MKLLLVFLMTVALGIAAEPPEMRRKAALLEKQGNWREAYELRVEILRTVDDSDSGTDLQKALDSQRRLRNEKSFDPLLAELTEKKAANPDFMLAAGMAFLHGQSHYGRLVDGEFLRGNQGSGQFVNVTDQDRLRALQCFMAALKGVEKGGPEEIVLLRRIGEALTLSRNNSGTLWRLYLLTDLTAVPDYSDPGDVITSEGAPVGPDGEPAWLDVPESWEKAASDGERWRWTMAEIARIDPRQGLYEKLGWARFCQQNYGVGTLSSYGWWNQPEVKERDGILQASTLEESESIARLASGVKRFTLREDYRYIPGLRELMRAGKTAASWQAGDLLVQIFLNRSQLPAAAETLEEVIRLHGKGGNDQRPKQLKQILGNWSRFGNTPTYFAADPVRIPYVFRNAKQVSLTLTEVKEDLVMNDIIEYIEANPRELDHARTSFAQIGNRLIGAKRQRYFGDELRAWTQDLTPDPDHRDTSADLDLGKLAPGCYILKSTLDDGNTSWVVVWVSDLVVLKRSEGGDEVFYLVDAKAGQPVAGELEFFGYRAEYLKKPQGKRRFNVITEHFRRKTDADGRLVLKGEDRKNNNRWHVIARAGERRAYLSDRNFRWYDPGDRTDYLAQKTIGITDRPVYRPGQTVHLKLWAGESRYDLGEQSSYAGKSANIEIRDGMNEVVFEKENLPADDYGGITFDFGLKEEASLGNYSVIVTGAVPHSNFTFRVEEYKKPEFEVKVEAPDEPVALGEAFEATVSANYFHGAPVTEATVKIKVERNFYNDRWFPSGEWDWLYGPGYWWFYPAYPWYPGWARWGCIRPAPPWWQHDRAGAPELVLEQTTAIGPDGKVKVKIDSSIAKLVHGDQDHRYSITAEVVDASRRTIVGTGSVLRRPRTLRCHRLAGPRLRQCRRQTHRHLRRPHPRWKKSRRRSHRHSLRHQPRCRWQDQGKGSREMDARGRQLDLRRLGTRPIPRRRSFHR